jgi:hypothetical protein
MVVPIDAGFRDYLHEMGEVGDRRQMHLEVRDGHMVAVDDRPGGNVVPVVWDDELRRYLIVPAD